MIQTETQLVSADNSGAKQLNVINLKGGSFRRYARIGDIVTVSIRAAIPNSKVEKGKIQVIVEIFGRATPIDLDFNQVEKI